MVLDASVSLPSPPKETVMSEIPKGLVGLHDKLIECHPSLARRQVWCTTCGFSRRVDNGLRDGWPKHCGYTMTIDSPEERVRMGSDNGYAG